MSKGLSSVFDKIALRRVDFFRHFQQLTNYIPEFFFLITLYNDENPIKICSVRFEFIAKTTETNKNK